MRHYLASSPAQAGAQEPEGLTLTAKILRLAPAWTPAFAGEQVEA